ncbi:hypothetical protein MRX96_029237 [Rhipicephalus microplus]
MDGTARGKTVGKGESRLDLRLFGPCSDVSVVKGRTLTGLTSTPCYPDGTLRDLGFLQQAQPPQGGHQSSALPSPVSRKTSQMPRGLSSRYDQRLHSGMPKDWLLLAASQPCDRVDGALPALSSRGLLPAASPA